MGLSTFVNMTFETIEAAGSWILSCGAGVQVIDSPELCEIILAKAAQVVAQYAQP